MIHRLLWKCLKAVWYQQLFTQQYCTHSHRFFHVIKSILLNEFWMRCYASCRLCLWFLNNLPLFSLIADDFSSYSFALRLCWNLMKWNWIKFKGDDDEWTHIFFLPEIDCLKKYMKVRDRSSNDVRDAFGKSTHGLDFPTSERSLKKHRPQFCMRKKTQK